ncbi:metal ABC transporter ATP-binding protein [Ureibacillus suwonensis]|uniref:Metal ABC transporter ATP-binding protein n=1 Tax=Ureibacillus suwonensis TaxID=313007 RepID=A0ABW0R9L0_9BACL
MKKPFVELKNVSFNYGLDPVLNNVSITVDEGDFLALVGPNGSGKSTLLKIILGLLKAKGEVTLFGEPVSSFQHREWIGYVSQKSNSFNTAFPATVKEVVQSGLTKKAGLFKRLPKDANKRVHEALAAVGMEQFQHRNIGELSGGQQQRVFIARALISEPKLLVLDEPTVGVDIKQVQSFYDMLGELNKKHNLTIILVTHDIETPSNQISHVAFLNKRILFYGNMEEYNQIPKEQIYEWYGHSVRAV